MTDEIISFPIIAKPHEMPSTVWASEYPDIVFMTDDEILAELEGFFHLQEQAI